MPVDAEVSTDGSNGTAASAADTFGLSPDLDSTIFTEIDPSNNAFLNVTKVGFSGDSVFYINEATMDNDSASRYTFLVSGKLSEANTLENRTSIPISDDDFSYEQISWDLVSLKDSFFAVHRNATSTTAQGMAVQFSTIGIYDAPEGMQPQSIMEGVISPTGLVSAFFEEGGELWIVQSNSVVAYDINISGDPL